MSKELTVKQDTMTSTQLTELLNGQGANYKKSRINEKIREMLPDEIAREAISLA